MDLLAWELLSEVLWNINKMTILIFMATCIYPIFTSSKTLGEIADLMQSSLVSLDDITEFQD